MPTFLSPPSGQHSRGSPVTVTGRTVADPATRRSARPDGTTNPLLPHTGSTWLAHTDEIPRDISTYQTSQSGLVYSTPQPPTTDGTDLHKTQPRKGKPMNKVLTTLRSEPVRALLYPLLVAVIGYGVTRGVVSADASGFILAVVAAALGLPAVESARHRVSPAPPHSGEPA